MEGAQRAECRGLKVEGGGFVSVGFTQFVAWLSQHLKDIDGECFVSCHLISSHLFHLVLLNTRVKGIEAAAVDSLKVARLKQVVPKSLQTSRLGSSLWWRLRSS